MRRPSVVSSNHVKGSRREEGAWNVFDKRYWPGDDFHDHLGFALRHEDLDLLVLKRVYDAVPPETMATFVRLGPTGALSRRAWYLYEFLTGRQLDIPDAKAVAAVDLLDGEAYFTATPRLSRRHKVRDNLLGAPAFCPVIRRTKALADFGKRDLGTMANEIVGRTGAYVVARAASFLLLADSRAQQETRQQKERGCLREPRRQNRLEFIRAPQDVPIWAMPCNSVEHSRDVGPWRHTGDSGWMY